MLCPGLLKKVENQFENIDVERGKKVFKSNLVLTTNVFFKWSSGQVVKWSSGQIFLDVKKDP